MIKTIFTALWACAVALGANYGYGWFKARQANAAPHENKTALELRKLKELSVPTIRDGAIKGYIVVKINYVADAGKMAAIGISPDSFVLDEAFSHLYAEQAIDYNRLERYDVAKFKAAVLKRANERLHADVVTDITLQEFTYMRATDVAR